MTIHGFMEPTCPVGGGLGNRLPETGNVFPFSCAHCSAGLMDLITPESEIGGSGLPLSSTTPSRSMDSLRPMEKSMTPKTMGCCFGILLIAMLAGCGESSEEAYERGYEAGYNDGQWEVCRELGSVAPGVKQRLKNCKGF